MSYYESDKHSYMTYKENKLNEYVFNLIRKEIGVLAEKVIEVGAGTGRFSNALVESYKSAVLIERAGDYAQKLKALFPLENVSVIEGDFEDYFDKESGCGATDLYCFHVLHHLSREQRKKLYEIIHSRKLRAIFIEPNPFNPALLVQIAITKDMSFKEEWQYLYLTKRRYIKELNEAGLSLEFHNYLCCLPPQLLNMILGWDAGSVRRALPFLEKISTTFVFPASYQFLVIK
jgi:SAM-dependent methyltransferase